MDDEDRSSVTTVIALGCTPALLQAIYQHGLQLENVILNKLDQSDEQELTDLVDVCQTSFDDLDCELEKLSDTDQDHYFAIDVAHDVLITSTDLAEIIEPFAGIEPVKFHHQINQAPNSQRREGKRAKHTRARMRGKKK